MTQFKLQLQGETEHAVLELAKAAKSKNINFFLIGATARDAILMAWGLPPSRATRNVDFAALIPNWNEFENLRTDLVQRGFNLTRNQHRFIKKGTIIDIIPFGDIEQPEGQITWPESSAVMNTTGFSEAYESTHAFLLGNEQVIRVANFCALSLLKIISWSDRPMERAQDAKNLLHIIRNYLDAGNFDRFYEQHGDLTDIEPFTIPSAGAALLGRDLKMLCREQSLNQIKNILKTELSNPSSLLISQMLQGESNSPEEIYAILERLNTEL